MSFNHWKDERKREEGCNWCKSFSWTTTELEKVDAPLLPYIPFFGWSNPLLLLFPSCEQPLTQFLEINSPPDKLNSTQRKVVSQESHLFHILYEMWNKYGERKWKFEGERKRSSLPSFHSSSFTYISLFLRSFSFFKWWWSPDPYSLFLSLLSLSPNFSDLV